MKKKEIINKVTAIFGVALILSTPFQSYAYASGASKVIAIVYSSLQGKSTSASGPTAGSNLARNVLGFQSAVAAPSDSGDHKLVSDAYNYKDFAQSVDPRTGAFSISYKVAEVRGNGFEDPQVPLSISYSSLSTSNKFGLGKGWTWSLTHYDVQSNMLSLSSGGSYKLGLGEGKLKYYKLKDLNVTIGSTFITLKYKDGREEKLDRAFGNLIKATNVQGYSAEFNYVQGNRLESISYKDPVGNGTIQKFEVLYPSDSMIFIKRNDGTKNGVITVLTKGKSGSVLASIQDPLKQEIQFSYKAPEEKEFQTDSLLTDITYPTGTSINVIYLEGGLASAKEGMSAPAVSKIKTVSLPRSESNEEEIHYTYSSDTSSKSNYLGYGFAGYKEGEDTLFFTPNDYIYSTIENRPAPDHKRIATKRVYNHFHQMMKEEVRLNEELLQSKEFTYPEWENKKFESLDANYNFPIEVKSNYYNGGSKRVEMTRQQYDDSGNILKTEDASGIIKEYQYLVSKKTFNGIVHLPEREVERSRLGGVNRITDYVYEEAKNAEGFPFQRLKAKVYKFSQKNCSVLDSGCGTVYKTEINSYTGNDNSTKTYALPTFTKLYATFGRKCKVAGRSMSYLSSSKENISTRIILSGKGEVLSKDVSTVNPFTSQVEKKLDARGIEVSYGYDAFGRVTKELVKAPTGEAPLQTTYTYAVNNRDFGGYGTSALVMQKPNGYKSYTVYDSLGRELEKYTQNNNKSGYNKLKSYVYGVTGKKVTETLYNEDVKGNPYQSSIQYQYDSLGREVFVTSPSGEKKVTTYNDAKHSQESYVQAADGETSPISVILFNEMKKPIKTVLLKRDRVPFSESSSKYDGFGNVIESVDVNGNKMSYSYSPIGQKQEEVYPDGRRIAYEYDLMSDDKLTKKSVILPEGKEIVLGTREYDFLGQIVSDSDPSENTIRYAYDSRGNLVRQTLRSGKQVQYTYNGFNNIIKKEVVGETAAYASTYEYDPVTQNLLYMNDATGTTTYSYNLDGSMESVTYPDKNQVSYKYDLQGTPVLLTDISGSQTLYYFNHTNGKLEKSEFITSKEGSQIERYSYDKFGRISQKTMPNKAETLYFYNEMGNLNLLSYHLKSGAAVLSYSYTYNKDMNIASRSRLGSGGIEVMAEEGYIYDALNNLSRYTCTGASCPKDQNGVAISSEEYTFDGLNNIKTAKVGFVGGDTNVTTYGYSDKDPNRLVSYSVIGAKGIQKSTLTYDADGNVTKDGDGNVLTYTPYNRLASFSKENKVTEYRYNGSGTIVSQKDGKSGKETKYYYNGNRLISELENGSTVSYFQVSGRVIGKSVSGSTTQFFLTDQAHSVIRVMEGSTLLEQNYAYTPYGQQSDLSQTSPSSGKQSGFGFNGERTDGKTGYQFLGKGYRAYNPALGRFMQYDTFSPFGKGGSNGYTFAKNNPITNFDPSGESATSYATMGVGILLAIIGIVGSVVTFGSSLALTAAGTSAAVSASATQIALAMTSLATGVASGATGIASSVYEHKAIEATASGNKNLAASYYKTASDLGWAAFTLGIASAVSGIASTFAGSSKTAIELERPIIPDDLALLVEDPPINFSKAKLLINNYQ